jgi:hypothetical protein
MAKLRKWEGVPYVVRRGQIVCGESKRFVTYDAAWNYVEKHGVPHWGHVIELTRAQARKGE